MAFDPFKLEDERGYSPDSFYTRATNDFDHGTVMNVKVPDHIIGQIADMQDRFPDYRSPAAFVRDAIVHRLHYLVDHEPQMMLGLDIQRALSRERAICIHEKYVKDVADQRDVVAGAKQALSNFETGREWRQLSIYLDEVVPELVQDLDENFADEIRQAANEVATRTARSRD